VSPARAPSPAPAGTAQEADQHYVSAGTLRATTDEDVADQSLALKLSVLLLLEDQR